MAEIEDDPLLKKYFRKRHSTQGTINLYTYVFKKYYEVNNLTPTSMIDKADMEEEQGIRLKKRSINDYLDQFEDYLEKNHTETTLKNAMSVIRTFYKFNSIQLPPTNRRPPNPTPTESLVQLPDGDDIRKAISHSSVKYQAFIILLASSGMRQGDVRSLTLQHLINSLTKYAKLHINDLFSIGELVDLLPEKHGPLEAVCPFASLCKNKHYSFDLSFSKPVTTYLTSNSFSVFPFFMAKILSSSRVPASILIGICTILSGSVGIFISLLGSVVTSTFSPLFYYSYCYVFLNIYFYLSCYFDNIITKYIYENLYSYRQEEKSFSWSFLFFHFLFLTPYDMGEYKIRGDMI